MPPSRASQRQNRSELRDAGAILRAAFRIRSDPCTFCRRVARGVASYLADREVALEGALILDAGTGGGCVPEVLHAEGARVVALDVRDHRLDGVVRTPFVLGRGEALPFTDGAFDIVVSSNVLEHVADRSGTIAELTRVCRPGGHLYLSWTTWLSPLGGHEMSPFHYLGPRTALRIYRALHGKPPENLPGRSLFVVHVGSVLRELRGTPLFVRDVAPRYWPSLRMLGRIPGVREAAMWNCVVLAEKGPLRQTRAGFA